MSSPTTRRVPVLPAGPKLAARRLAERRARQRRVARRVGYAAASCVPVLLLGWVALSSPLLDVDRVRVTGATSPALVRDAARVPPGRPLVRVDTEEVRRRVGELGGLADVQVRRDWPGTLEIVVREQVPVAAVEQPDGSRRLVAADGTAYGTAAEAVPGVVALAVPAPGPSPDDATTRAALDVLAELSPALRAQVATVRGLSPVSTLLVLQGGREVTWGPPGDRAQDKSATVLLLTTRPGGDIDVTSPGVATVQQAEP